MATERDEPVRSAKHARVLIYSHDTFGLGHLRRSRAIANALADLNLPARLVERITYTGYLRRELPQLPIHYSYPCITRGNFILVTTGGGGI